MDPLSVMVRANWGDWQGDWDDFDAAHTDLGPSKPPKSLVVQVWQGMEIEAVSSKCRVLIGTGADKSVTVKAYGSLWLNVKHGFEAAVDLLRDAYGDERQEVERTLNSDELVPRQPCDAVGPGGMAAPRPLRPVAD
jgi:hypothetical protein